MKERILKQGMFLVAEKGFRNTGISELLKTVSIPKGSFYYYFKSKTDFGLQLIRYASAGLVSELEDYFSKDVPPLKRIENYFDSKIDIYKNETCTCNCIFGKLSQELSSEEPEFQLELSNLFVIWRNYFRDALLEAESNGEVKLEYNAEVLARFAISGWEGAITQGKILQSLDPLIEFKKIFFSILNQRTEK